MNRGIAPSSRSAKSLSGNFLFNAAYQLTRIITPIITIPYLSRVLGPELVGIYSYTNSIAYYFTLFAVLGMSLYGVRLIATVRTDRARLSRTFWSAYASQLVVGVLTLAVYAAYAASPWQGYGVITWIWAFWVVSAVLDVSWLFFGVEEFRMPAVRSIALKALELAAIFLFVKSKDDLWLYVAISSVEYLVNSLALWPWVHRYVDFYRPSWAEVRVHFRPSLLLFVPVIAVSLYTSMDKILLGALSDMTQTGYFEYAEKINRLLTALITALGTVVLPRMSAILAKGERERGLHLIESTIWLMQVGAMALMFGTIGIAPSLVPVFFGNEFLPCIELMSVLSAMIPIICFSNVVGKQWLLPSGRDGDYTRAVCGGAAVNVLVNLVVIPHFGAMGAVIGSLSAEVAVLAIQIFYIRSELPVASYFKNALSFVGVGFAEMLAIWLCSSMLSALGIDSIALLAIEFFCGAAVYTVLALAWCLATKDRNFEVVKAHLVAKLSQKHRKGDAR